MGGQTKVEHQQALKAAIQSVVRARMDGVMQNVFVNDPFDEDRFRQARPLHAALVPHEIFKGSHFERKFVTSFGGVWELLARIVAEQGLGYATMGHSVVGMVGAERLRRIEETLDRLEHRRKGEARRGPDWDTEIAYILDGGGQEQEATVTCDIYAEDRRSPVPRKYAFEVKAPLPNSDQTRASKAKLLRLRAMDPPQVDGAFFALPYNPFGRREDYVWWPATRWFDMRRDEVVLMGDGFWEFVGGPGTYQAFVDAVNEIGREYKHRIYRDYLDMEPPPEAEAPELSTT